MSLNFEFQELVQLYADGQASATEVELLCQQLRESADARRSFISLMNLDSALEAISAEWVAAHSRISPVQISSAQIRPAIPERRRRVLVRKRYLAVFAMCLALLVGNLWHQSFKDRVYATVENGTGVRELTNGAQLRDEWIEIAGGTVEVMTPTAARVGHRGTRYISIRVTPATQHDARPIGSRHSSFCQKVHGGYTLWGGGRLRNEVRGGRTALG